MTARTTLPLTNIRRAVLVGVVLLSALVVLPVRAERAWACSCGGLTDAEAFDRSGAVFIGELTERREPTVALSSEADVRLVFTVERVFKGEVHATQSVVTAADGSSCGLEISGPGPHLIFGRTRGATTEIEAGLCDGTRALAAESVPEAFGAGSAPIGGSSAIGHDRSGLWIASAAGVVLVGLIATLIAVSLWVYRRMRRPRPAS